jgi:hypothetical protein
LHGCRHRKAEPYLHACAVALHRGIDEIVDFREGNDFSKLAVDLLRGQPKD